MGEEVTPIGLQRNYALDCMKNGRVYSSDSTNVYGVPVKVKFMILTTKCSPRPSYHYKTLFNAYQASINLTNSS